MEQAVSQQNWASGELSPKMWARHELPIYQAGAERIVNFISETAGPLRFRPGFQFVFGTRRYQPAWLYPFQFNDADAYEMEFTTGYIRFYRNGGIITSTVVNITGATQATTCVITSASHGLSNGQEVIINGVVGMIQLNNRSFIVTGATTNTFELYDNFGNPINSTAYTAYSSGGTATLVYEIQSPYTIADIPHLKIGQNADVLYIVHPNYEPLKLTRLGDNNWTLALFTRSGTDPCGSQITISGITQANPAKVTATSHGYSTGQQIIINTVVGMTELNNSTGGGVFTITKVDSDHFTLNGVDSTGYTAYVSGGYSMDKTQLVGAVAFYQGRLYYGYSDTYPESIWGSEPLDDSGNPQYDAFTLGSDPADAFKFTLSPISAKVDKIESLVPTLNFLAICTFEGISAANGGGGFTSASGAISPSTIQVAPTVTAGVLQQITPFLVGLTMVYVHRSGLIFYSQEFDIFYNAFNAMDKDLTCDQWSQSAVPNGSGIIQMVYQVGRPSAFWFARNDGVMIGRTYMVKENVNGIHEHEIGGTDAEVISVGMMPRTNAYDQLWIVSQRVIGGNTVCFVEYMNDDIVVPQLDDYCTGDANQGADILTWQNAMFEAQKKYVYVDAALTYDGSVFGLDAGVNLTPGNNLTIDGAFNDWNSSSALTNWSNVGTIAQVSTPVYGSSTYAVEISGTGFGGIGKIFQLYSDYAFLRGQVVTFSVAVLCSSPSTAYIEIADGVDNVQSAFHPGDGQWHVLTVSRIISNLAGQVAFICEVQASGTAYFDDAVATVADLITISANMAFFNSSMVGKQIWKQSQNGVGMGRAQIVDFISSTLVVCILLTSFDNANAIPAGEWYLTTNVVSGIWHLNGEYVDVMADGGDASAVGSTTDGFGRSLVQVVNGAITLQYQASVVHVGEPYNGMIRTMAWTPQSQAGVTTAKNKTVNRLGVKFLNTLGARYGTSLYNMETVQFAMPSDLMGRPSPLFSGVKALVIEDDKNYDKHVYVQQVRPLPCIVEAIVPFVDSDDD